MAAAFRKPSSLRCSVPLSLQVQLPNVSAPEAQPAGCLGSSRSDESKRMMSHAKRSALLAASWTLGVLLFFTHLTQPNMALERAVGVGMGR